MPAHPKLTRPDEASTEAAMNRTLDALAAVFQALGAGEHTLSIASTRTDGAHLSRSADLSLATDPVRMAVLNEDAYAALAMLLVFALEGGTVTGAALMATTAAEPRPRAYCWTVRDGWLHPMDTADVRAAVTPCPGSSAVDREVYPAPALIQPTGMDEENDRG
ncbi:hypothetical protein [Streptomyces mirabilis]|uniref:hypothetical protein n=1 Tax=Streptomyces mirabilis TaxID=68239 RepID=UPI00340DF48C